MDIGSLQTLFYNTLSITSTGHQNSTQNQKNLNLRGKS